MSNKLLWLSIGENCLPDDILKRHKLKSFSTPYSSARSNIDHCIKLENECYTKFLDPILLKHEMAWTTPVVRSTYIHQIDNIFDASCSQGFEFTHHDPINSPDDFHSYQRKCERMLSINNDVVFLYHHRINNNSNIPLLKDKLNEFSNFYTQRNINCTIILFYQSIIQSKHQKSLIFHGRHTNILEFEFQTKNIWGGTNQDIFWARTDDDLIQKMLMQSMNYFNEY